MDNIRAYKYEFVQDLHSSPLFFLSMLPETSNIISSCLSQHLHLKIKIYLGFINYCKELYFFFLLLFSLFCIFFSLKPQAKLTHTCGWMQEFFLLMKSMQKLGRLNKELLWHFGSVMTSVVQDWKGGSSNSSSRNYSQSGRGHLKRRWRKLWEWEFIQRFLEGYPGSSAFAALIFG